jgi:protein involved in plasmid replication-relaxation
MRGGEKKADRLVRLDEALSELDREIIGLVDRLALLTGSQIRRLYFDDSELGRTGDHRARRALLGLTKLGVLTRLERRIGGKKFGSEGFCYRLAADGQRLIAWWRDGAADLARLRPEPGARFVRHRLAVSEVYALFIEAGRHTHGRQVEVLDFEAEPASWREFDGSFGGRMRQLKPDAFLKLGVGEFEHWWFCELDLGTVSRRARESQAAVYRAYWRSGAAGDVMPRVLWITPNELVGDRVRAAIQPSGEPHGLFVITSLANAVDAATTATSEVDS